MDFQTDKRMTIAEVAKLCGVSKTTISRFLNGKYENISAETRERIRLKIEELDYRPNRSAQRLKAEHSMLIGCIIGDVCSPFSGLLLSGINRVCEAAGYQVLFADSRDNPEREKKALEGFIDNKVDGLIVNPSGGNDELLISTRDSGIPVVLADRGLLTEGKLDTVCCDNRNSARETTEYLFDCGYAHVAFFTIGNRKITPRIHRNMGYTDAVDARAADGSERIIYEFDIKDDDSCRACLRDYIKRFPGERIAALAVNGMTAQHMLIAMQAEGIEAGKNFGLCTYDDWAYFKLLTPAISSLSLSTEIIGEESANMLLDRLSGDRAYDAPASYMEIPAKLKIRESTVKE